MRRHLPALCQCADGVRGATLDPQLHRRHAGAPSHGASRSAVRRHPETPRSAPFLPVGTTVVLNGLPTTIDTLALLHVFIPSIRTVLRWDICNYPAIEGPKQRARF